MSCAHVFCPCQLRMPHSTCTCQMRMPSCLLTHEPSCQTDMLPVQILQHILQTPSSNRNRTAHAWTRVNASTTGQSRGHVLHEAHTHIHQKPQKSTYLGASRAGVSSSSFESPCCIALGFLPLFFLRRGDWPSCATNLDLLVTICSYGAEFKIACLM